MCCIIHASLLHRAINQAQKGDKSICSHKEQREDEKQVFCCVHARLFIMPVTIFKPEK